MIMIVTMDGESFTVDSYSEYTEDKTMKSIEIIHNHKQIIIPIHNIAQIISL